jgi:hypothetical protein
MLHLCGRKLDRPNETETVEVATNASKISPSTLNAGHSTLRRSGPSGGAPRAFPSRRKRALRIDHARTARRGTALRPNSLPHRKLRRADRISGKTGTS